MEKIILAVMQIYCRAGGVRGWGRAACATPVIHRRFQISPFFSRLPQAQWVSSLACELVRSRNITYMKLWWQEGSSVESRYELKVTYSVRVW
jgi:hypothetical protein